jgi:DMSO/TMAO reductase YedYZ molybdopterin-dependent catalytic subunit
MKLRRQCEGGWTTKANRGERVENRKLTRDKVISVVRGRELVGVYWEGTDASEVLFECSPKKADRIIAVFEEDESDEETGKREWEN